MQSTWGRPLKMVQKLQVVKKNAAAGLVSGGHRKEDIVLNSVSFLLPLKFQIRDFLAFSSQLPTHRTPR